MKTFGLFPVLVVLIVVVNVVAGCYSSVDAPQLCGVIAWSLTVVLLIGCFVLIGRVPPIVTWVGVLVDQRNKISLSRFQLVLWSLLVIATIITEGILNALWKVPGPLTLNVPSQMWILLGLSSGSAVAAPIVLGMKADKGTLDTNAVMQHAWSDMFYGDETGNADQVDFSKVQQFFLTVVLVVAYATEVVMILLHPSAATTDGKPMLYFPALDTGLVALMGVSQVAYISYKALPQSKTDAGNVVAPPPVVNPAPPPV
jgi:hypothetical protein